MEISFPFVACVRTAGRKKICQIVAVQFLQGGLGPFRGLDAPRAPKTNDFRSQSGLKAVRASHHRWVNASRQRRMYRELVVGANFRVADNPFTDPERAAGSDESLPSPQTDASEKI